MHERPRFPGLHGSPWTVVLLVGTTVAMERGPGTIDAPGAARRLRLWSVVHDKAPLSRRHDYPLFA